MPNPPHTSLAVTPAHLDNIDKTSYMITAQSVDRTNLTVLHIPESIRILEKFAFADCTSLEYVHFNSSLTHIEYGVFKACPKLKYVILPEKLKVLNTGCFFKCESLQDAIVPRVQYMGAAVFSCCPNLKNVTYKVDIVPLQTFHGCCSLQKIDLPDYVTYIEMQAFAKCSALTSITIAQNGSQLEYIGHGAFQHCSALKSFNIDKSSIEGVEKHAFCGCHTLSQVSLPPTIWYIEESSFLYCFALVTIDLSHTSLVKIGKHAFAWCSNAKSIVLPDCVNHIHEGAFMCCFSLQTMTLPKRLTILGQKAFKSCKLLVSINLPPLLESLQSETFGYCISLQYVNLNSVCDLGPKCFAHCYNLHRIYIPDSVTSIGMGCFAKCIILKHIHFSNKLRAINEYAFANCIAIDQLIFPNTQLQIHKRAFYRCESLNSVYFAESIKFHDIYASSFPFQLYEPIVRPAHVFFASVFASESFINEQKRALIASPYGHLFTTHCQLYFKEVQLMHESNRYWNSKTHIKSFQSVVTFLLCCERNAINHDVAMMVLKCLKLSDTFQTPIKGQYNSPLVF